jgi:hypothetical protein
MAVVDQRVGARGTESTAERGELSSVEMLVAKHQHWMLGKRPLDPGEGPVVERPREVDAECLGAERLAERGQSRGNHEGDPPICGSSLTLCSQAPIV